MGLMDNWKDLYSKEEKGWIKKKFNKSIKTKDMDKEALEEEFERLFNKKRKFTTLSRLAGEIGCRRKFKKMIVGKTVYVDDGGREKVLVSRNPISYQSKTRYEWERQNNKKLNKTDVVIHLNGNNRDYSKENLVSMTRSEFIKYCDSKGLPTKTRLLLAKLETKKNNITGRGDYSKEEVEWIKRIKIDGRARMGFWKDKAKEFNLLFNKKRSNKDLSVLWNRLNKER